MEQEWPVLKCIKKEELRCIPVSYTHLDVYKRQQFELSSYKRLIDIYSSTAKTVDALMKLELPALSKLMWHQTGKEFEISEQMADSVAVIKVIAESYTGKTCRR